MRPGWLLAAGLTLGLGGCAESESEPELETATEHGARSFADSSRHGQYGNDFSCADCHAAGAVRERILTGAPMANVVARPTYWGGAELDLLRAINHCRSFFMAAADPWLATDYEAEAMYAYLASLGLEPSEPVAFTLPSALEDLPCSSQSNERGASLYEAACRDCHGRVHTGEGKRSVSVPILPEDVLAEHAVHEPPVTRQAFVSKVRHGGFYEEGGTMPPFSLEVLDDAALTELLDFLGVGAGAYCP